MIICSPIRPSLSPSPAYRKRQFTIMIKCCAQKRCEPLENCLFPNTMIDQSHSHGGGYWVGKKKLCCIKCFCSRATRASAVLRCPLFQRASLQYGLSQTGSIQGVAFLFFEGTFLRVFGNCNLDMKSKTPRGVGCPKSTVTWDV